jgi:hypothetical protein
MKGGSEEGLALCFVLGEGYPAYGAAAKGKQKKTKKKNLACRLFYIVLFYIKLMSVN